MNRARARSLAGLHQPRRTIAIGAPQAAAFPAGIRIVNACVEALGVEAHGVRNAQHDHLAVFQSHEAVIEVGRRDWNVLAEPNGIVLVDPGVVARLYAAVFEAFKARAGIFVELPALRTMIAGRRRSIERPFAETPVEAHKVAAR